MELHIVTINPLELIHIHLETNFGYTGFQDFIFKIAGLEVGKINYSVFLHSADKFLHWHLQNCATTFRIELSSIKRS